MRAVVEWNGRRRGWAPHVAPVSVHLGLAGRELYRTPDGLYAVEPGRLLVIDGGQTVASVVPGQEPSAGLAVLFPAALVADVQRAGLTPDDRLLDDPHGPSAPVPLMERTYPVPVRLRALLFALRDAQRTAPSQVEERQHDLLEAVLELEGDDARGSESVPAVRASTRAELFRRLVRAREYLDATFDRPVTLAELGRVAALSRHRLLRLFRASFGLTPQRYVHRLRMERAAALLRATAAPVGEVAARVGFDSFGSFSAAFRRHHGLTPRALRARAR